MPGRDIKFINNQIYHIFNKTTDRRRIFRDTSLTELFLDLLKYYRSTKSVLKYHRYKNLPDGLRSLFDRQLLIKKYYLVEIFCFNIMPTHFHLLIRQKQNGGISSYLSNVLNSFTRYYNIKFDHGGSLFFKPFRAVHVASEEQCKHVTRYIHLNWYSAGLVSNVEDIFSHPNSSLPIYFNNKKEQELVETDYVLGLFGDNRKRYRKFILDNADYQRSLERLKYAQKWL